jgi:DNA repair ATPase RecN
MKRTMIMVCLLFAFAILPVQKASAQADEIAQLLLNLEKLRQFRSILKQMKQGYEILTGGYNTVINIAQGNFKIHKAFLDGLLAVSPAVRKYKRVADIIDYQIILVKEYKDALGRYLQDTHFTQEELTYITGIYDNLLKQSLRNLDELTGVITAGKMRMSDDERLKAIDRIFEDMQDKLVFLRDFNSNTTLLAVQRAKEKNDVKTIQHIYGINN